MSDELPKKGDSIIFIDVESLPVEKENSLWLQLSSHIEPKPDESLEDRLNRIEMIRRDTALNGPLGRVWMIGFAIGAQDPVLLIGDGSEEGEIKVLQDFLKAVEEQKNPWWVGHNISGYDIPFLQVRSLKNRIPDLARKMGRVRGKPWESRILDTQKLWPRTGADRSVWKDGLMGMAKLDTICAVLGISQQVGVMGPNVYDAFLNGDIQGVADHLDADIRQVREVFKRLWPIL